MTRQPKFDRDEVLDKAMQLFWQKGFHAVTTRDIQEFLGMHPGSVYAAFGGKSDMFKETLSAYGDRVMAELDEAMANSESISDGFQAFFTQTLDPDRDLQPSNMCMLSMSLRDQRDDDEIAAHTRDLLVRVGGRFQTYVDQALARGDFVQPENMKAGITRYLQVQLLGLRTAVSNGVHGQELIDLIEDVFKRLKPVT